MKLGRADGQPVPTPCTPLHTVPQARGKEHCSWTPCRQQSLRSATQGGCYLPGPLWLPSQIRIPIGKGVCLHTWSHLNIALVGDYGACGL